MIIFQLIPILFIIAGIANIVFPKAAWYMRTGWQFKNAEPSDIALVMIRIGGVIAVIIGLYILMSGFPFNNLP